MDDFGTFDEDQMMKDLEKEMKKKEKNKKTGDEDLKLNEEDMAKLQQATHDKHMLAGKDGEIHHVAEIDFIIADILKHQDKAFKIERHMEELKEQVE